MPRSSRLGRDFSPRLGPGTSSPGSGLAPLSRLGWHGSSGWASAPSPGWAGMSYPAGPVARKPSWADVPLPPPGRPPRRGPLPRQGLWPAAPAGPLPPHTPAPQWAYSRAAPGWARSGGSVLAGIPSPGRRLQCPGWARPGFPWPRLGFSLPGRIISPQAGLTPCGLRFALSGTYSSSGIASSALCQSWDASRLRLAHPPSLYAGPGMPLGSDQHTPPLLVSLILRRRIRLMTWRS
jgi:hypothetical protein